MSRLYHGVPGIDADDHGTVAQRHLEKVELAEVGPCPTAICAESSPSILQRVFPATPQRDQNTAVTGMFWVVTPVLHSAHKEPVQVSVGRELWQMSAQGIFL
jgi:hypothetical protein